MTEIFASWIRRRFIYLPVNFAFYSFFHPSALFFFLNYFFRGNPPVPCTKPEFWGSPCPAAPAVRCLRGRGAVARRCLPRPALSAPSGAAIGILSCHQQPSAAIGSPLALSGGAPARPSEPRTEPATGLARPPQRPRPRPGGSRGTVMWPSPASHPRGETRRGKGHRDGPLRVYVTHLSP